MKRFKNRFVSDNPVSVEQRFREFLLDELSKVPHNFKPRQYGPVLAIPRFLQHWIARSYGNRPDMRLSQQAKMTTFNGYPVIDGYEFAVVIFFPDTAVLNPHTIYRIEFSSNLKSLPDGQQEKSS